MTIRQWSLRSHLSALLLVTIGVTVSIVAVAALVWKVPQAERRSLAELRAETSQVAARLVVLLRARQVRLEMLAGLARSRGAAEADLLLQDNVGQARNFQALYLLAPDGTVLAARRSGQPPGQASDLLGDDLSGNALFTQARQREGVVWSAKSLSLMSGLDTVAAALRLADGRVLIGEIAQAELLRTMQAAAGRHDSAIWVIDQAGEVIADTDGGRQVGRFNLHTWPPLQVLRHGGTPPNEARLEGRRLQIVLTQVPALDWFLLGSVPAGWQHPSVRELFGNVAMAFVGCLVIGLLMAPFWARRMGRGLQDMLTRAALTTSGQDQGRSWPRGSVREFNALSADLEQMAATLQEREQKVHAIFNASPVPMVVTDRADGMRLVDVNEAWCQALGFAREEAIGRTGPELGLFGAEQFASLEPIVRGEMQSMDFALRRRDGALLQVRLFGRRAVLDGADWVIWAPVDLGPMRRIEAELHELNQQLETRVEQRTQALSEAHAQLTQTVQQLAVAQDELVRSDKLAALGSLVAGVAHELNTPLGNGVMAVSAVAEALQRFRTGSASGLRRSGLQQLVDSVAQGVDIGQRNLARAAGLVQSFKQVAVDQTSAQRRSFELAEVVHEMVVSLRPSLGRTPYRIEVDLPASGLRLDSYPGALGQTIGNLIQNAVVHGFDGRDHGTVRLSGWRTADGRIALQVRDDGKGIAARHIERIFEPFMTTRQGRGGSGLGLHISRNAVEGLLGGSLAVHSTVGQGTCFELLLPAVAPQPDPQHGAAMMGVA